LDSWRAPRRADGSACLLRAGWYETQTPARADVNLFLNQFCQSLRHHLLIGNVSNVAQKTVNGLNLYQIRWWGLPDTDVSHALRGTLYAFQDGQTIGVLMASDSGQYGDLVLKTAQSLVCSVKTNQLSSLNVAQALR
jgi:hypothetical protein